MDMLKRLSEELMISEDGVKEVLEFGVKKTAVSEETKDTRTIIKSAPSTKKSSISEEELNDIIDLIKSQFSDKEFKSSDLSEICNLVNITTRQMPSRLKKLSEQNLLEDLGGSPKKYRVK